MKKRLLVSAVLFVLFVLFVASGCTGLNNSLAQSSVIVRAMQDHTILALKVDVDPTAIKITYDEEASSYLQGSNWWFATLPDGSEYKCGKMKGKDAVCIKKTSPKSTAAPTAADKKTGKKKKQ